MSEQRLLTMSELVYLRTNLEQVESDGSLLAKYRLDVRHALDTIDALIEVCQHYAALFDGAAYLGPDNAAYMGPNYTRYSRVEADTGRRAKDMLGRMKYV